METTTTTTTTTTTVRSTEVVSIGFNIGFLRTPIGLLMAIELFVLMLAWTLLVSCCYILAPQLGFAAFGFIVSWMATLALFIIFNCGLHGSLCANAPWGTIQVFANIIFALLCFISACCVAPIASKSSSGNLGASCAFGYIGTVLYVISALLCFRKAYGRFPWQSSSGTATNT